MLINLWVVLPGIVERLFEKGLCYWWDFFGGIGAVEGLEAVVHEFQRMRASFLYLSIDGPARVACLSFPTLVIDLLADLCPPQIIDVWPAQIAKELPTFFLRQ